MLRLMNSTAPAPPPHLVKRLHKGVLWRYRVDSSEKQFDDYRLALIEVISV